MNTAVVSIQSSHGTGSERSLTSGGDDEMIWALGRSNTSDGHDCLEFISEYSRHVIQYILNFELCLVTYSPVTCLVAL